MMLCLSGKYTLRIAYEKQREEQHRMVSLFSQNLTGRLGRIVYHLR